MRITHGRRGNAPVLGGEGGVKRLITVYLDDFNPERPADRRDHKCRSGPDLDSGLQSQDDVGHHVAGPGGVTELRTVQRNRPDVTDGDRTDRYDIQRINVLGHFRMRQAGHKRDVVVGYNFQIRPDDSHLVSRTFNRSATVRTRKHGRAEYRSIRPLDNQCVSDRRHREVRMVNKHLEFLDTLGHGGKRIFHVRRGHVRVHVGDSVESQGPLRGVSGCTKQLDAVGVNLHCQAGGDVGGRVAVFGSVDELRIVQDQRPYVTGGHGNRNVRRHRNRTLKRTRTGDSGIGIVQSGRNVNLDGERDGVRDSDRRFISDTRLEVPRNITVDDRRQARGDIGEVQAEEVAQAGRA